MPNSEIREQNTSCSITISPKDSAVERVTAMAEEFFDKEEISPAVSAKCCVVIDEVVSNVGLYSGASELTAEIRRGEGMIVMRFTDNGRPYDPLQHTDPDVTLGLEERQIGGLGIFMVKKLMDTVSYERSGDRNVLCVGKKV